jgi:hypothetical protein
MSSIEAGRQRLCVLAAFAALVVPALAQQGNIRSTIHFRLKADRVADFQSAIKDMNGALKTAGWEHPGLWWQSMSGPAEYVLVIYNSKWAELGVNLATDPKFKEQRAAIAAVGARLNQCLERSERIIAEVLPDLSLPRTADPPAMVRTIRTRVRPGKTAEYEALIKSDLLPALKKAGAKSYTLARTRYGGPNTEYLSATGLKDWAELDEPNPMRKAMGDQAYNQFLAKLQALVLGSEINLYRYRADLSYRPGVQSPTGGN